MSDTTRTYLSFRVDELEALFLKASETVDLKLLEEIEFELSYRSTKRALKLSTRLEQFQEELSETLGSDDKLSRIKNSMRRRSFGGTLRAWRTYAQRISDQPMLSGDIIEIWDFIYDIWRNKTSDYFVFSDDEIQFMEIDASPLAGILSHFGYRTKVKTNVRRAILNELIYAEIPAIVNHHEWGHPKSTKRIRKIESTLGGLAFPHRNQKAFEGAVKAWDTDLNWFLNERNDHR